MKKRTLSQVSVLLLFFLVPMLDLFRIDLTHLHFYVLRRSFAFSEGLILLLVILTLVIFFLGISKWFGRQFCGWMCPHNTFSGYLTKITNSKTLKNNKGLRETIDIGLSVIFSPIIAFAFVAYFYNPQELLNDIVTFNTGGWAFWAYILIIGFFFLMINRLRHKFCRSTCPYGMLQMILSDKNSQKGGFHNMFKGVGLVLTLALVGMGAAALYLIYTSTGYSVSVAKNKDAAGIIIQDFYLYEYDLTMENLTPDQETYTVTLKNVPDNWEVTIPETITIDANSTYKNKILFKAHKSSLNNNYIMVLEIKNSDGKTMEKQINIFPGRK